MKFNSWRLYVCMLAAISAAHAQDLPYKYSGVHYDATSEQYFVNNRPKFNIQPMGSSKFLDRIEYSIDDVAFAPYSNGIQFNEEGLHTLRFKAVDPVNNWSPVQSFRIFADLTKPTSQLSWFGDSYNHDGKHFVSPRSKLTITANDNLSGVSRIVWKKGESNILEYRTPQAFEKEGEYSFNFMSIDNVGNVEPWQTHSFFVDASHPQSAISLKGESHKLKDRLYTKLGSLLELTSTDSGAGLKDIEVKINGGEVMKYERPITLDKKITKIQFRGVDNVGNVEKWQEFVVLVDTDAPELDVKKVGRHQLMGGKIYATSGFKLEMSVMDKDSGLKSLSVNDQVKPSGTKEVMTFDKEGTFEVTVSAFDNVGNKSTPQVMTVVVDNTPPVSQMKTEVALVEREGVLYSSIPNKLSISSEDLGVGVGHVEVSYDGKNYMKLAGDIDFATWKQQQRTLFYRAKDHLGNVEAEKKLTIAIRDKGPAVGLFVETEEHGNVPLSELRGRSNRAPASVKRTKETNKGKE